MSHASTARLVPALLPLLHASRSNSHRLGVVGFSSATNTRALKTGPMSPNTAAVGRGTRYSDETTVDATTLWSDLINLRLHYHHNPNYSKAAASRRYFFRAGRHRPVALARATLLKESLPQSLALLVPPFSLSLLYSTQITACYSTTSSVRPAGTLASRLGRRTIPVSSISLKVQRRRQSQYPNVNQNSSRLFSTSPAIMGSTLRTNDASTPFKVLVVGGSYCGLAAAFNLSDLCTGKAARAAASYQGQEGG